jgi:hypothetical protein
MHSQLSTSIWTSLFPSKPERMKSWKLRNAAWPSHCLCSKKSTLPTGKPKKTIQPLINMRWRC